MTEFKVNMEARKRERKSRYWGFPGGSDGKESACQVGDPCLMPGLGRSLGERNGNPLQYSHLENSKDRGARWLQSRGSQRARCD